MTWVKIDDEFYTHPKVSILRADVMLACIGLHTLALSWCNHKLTDGVVPINQVFRLAGDLTLALPSGNPHMLINELLRVGMWEHLPGDENAYLIHDYLDYQPSRAQVEALKEAQSKAGRQTAAKRWGAESIATPIATPIVDSDDFPSGKFQPRAESIATPIATPIAIPIAPPVGVECSVPVPVPGPKKEKKKLSSTEAADTSPPNDDATTVFQHWRTAMGKTERAVFDNKRKARVRWALGLYSLADCLAAIDGCAASEFHNGRDPKSNGKRYDDLTLIFRDAEHVERFLQKPRDTSCWDLATEWGRPEFGEEGP